MFFILFANDSIVLLSGGAYVGATRAMQVLMPTVLLIALSNMTGIQILVPMGKERAVMISVICGAVIDFISNLIYIPHFSAAGAAMSTLSAEAVVLAIQVVYIRNYLKTLLKRVVVHKILISMSAATVVGFLIVKYVFLSVFFRLLIGGCTFFGLYFGLLLLQRDTFLLGFIQPIWEKIKVKLKANKV